MSCDAAMLVQGHVCLNSLKSTGSTLCKMPWTCCLWSFVVQVAMEVGQAYAEEIGAIFFETSAKEGTNIQQLFSAVGE